MHYAVVIERSPTGFGVYVPDLPGCVAMAESEAEVRALIREAMELHIDSLREDGEEVPSPETRVGYIDIPSAA